MNFHKLIECSEERGRDTFLEDIPKLEEVHVIGEAREGGEIVSTHYDCPVRLELLETSEELDLVERVEEFKGLIEEEERRVLEEHHDESEFGESFHVVELL